MGLSFYSQWGWLVRQPPPPQARLISNIGLTSVWTWRDAGSLMVHVLCVSYVRGSVEHLTNPSSSSSAADLLTRPILFHTGFGSKVYVNVQSASLNAAPSVTPSPISHHTVLIYFIGITLAPHHQYFETSPYSCSIHLLRRVPPHLQLASWC